MGLVAVSAGVTTGGNPGIQALTTVGPAIGAIFVAGTLIYLFAYLDLLEATTGDRPKIHHQLVSLIVPLFIAFAGIVLYSSLQYV